MRLSNRKKAPIYNFLLTFSLLFAIIGGAMTFLNIIKLPVFGKMASISLLLIGGAGLVIIFLRGRQIFEYDSDGEALNFKNHSIIPFLGKELWISPTGKISPCCAPDEMRQTLGNFGNIENNTIESILNSDNYINLITHYKQIPLCKTCNMRKP